MLLAVVVITKIKLHELLLELKTFFLFKRTTIRMDVAKRSERNILIIIIANIEN